MMLIQQYDVTQKELNQKFDKCTDAGSTLYVSRLDMVCFFFLRIGNLKFLVKCNETGKVIRKKHWNDETHAVVKQLKEEHKPSRLGCFILIALNVLIFGILIYHMITTM